MDLLTFISTAIESLAWPVVVIAALCLFRPPLTALINAIKDAKFKVSTGDTTLEGELNTVRQKLEKVSEKQLAEPIKQLASSSPARAIEESWLELKKTAAGSISETTEMAPLKIADMLVDKNILTRREAEAFYKLFEINDEVTKPGSRYVTDPSSASAYGSLAQTLSEKIRKNT